MPKEIPLSKEAQSIRQGIYKHFKGGEYLVLGVALHSETQEEMVVYQHLLDGVASQSYFWVRPVTMFLETVDKPEHNGPRFTFLREQ